MAELPFPDTTNLQRILARFRGSTAYIIEMTDGSGRALGNNGDLLMHTVFSRLIPELGIGVTDDPRQADLVLVPPSGALLERYSFPALLTERLKGFESIPVVVFPSSAYFPSVDPSSMFRNRGAETVLLLREERSYVHLAEQWGNVLSAEGVALELDHDVVASGHKHVIDIIGSGAGGAGLLIAARRDRERNAETMSAPVAAGTHRRNWRNQVAHLVPYGRARTWMSRTARRDVIEAASSELLEAVPSALLETHVASAKRSTRVDASATQFATFAEYRRLIGRADAVVTNRLHVGLPAAILGKRVVLVEGGYHKITGVYQRSMSRADNVTVVNANEARD